MKYLPYLIFTMFSGVWSGNSFCADVLQEAMPVNIYIKKIPPHVGQNDGQIAQDKKIAVETFSVLFDIHSGYFLLLVDDFSRPEKWIAAEFDSENILHEFDNFFSSRNLKLIHGKKIYCDCLGEHHKKDGVNFYKIREAQLFAK